MTPKEFEAEERTGRLVGISFHGLIGGLLGFGFAGIFFSNIVFHVICGVLGIFVGTIGGMMQEEEAKLFSSHTSLTEQSTTEIPPKITREEPDQTKNHINRFNLIKGSDL